MTPRDIEKLKAIGYTVRKVLDLGWDGFTPAANRAIQEETWEDGGDIGDGDDFFASEEAAWQGCLAHAQSPEGLKATMADKVRWLLANGETTFTGSGRFEMSGPHDDGFHATCRQAIGIFRADSPEAAVDALFWKVP